MIEQEHLLSEEAPEDWSETRILEKLTKWTGGDRAEAERWYYDVSIPAFGNKTAHQVHASGLNEALDDYVEGLLAGEFA